MKKFSFHLLIVAFTFALISNSFAQNPLITIFSSDGYQFKVIMDGKEMNQSFASRVEYMEMDNDWAKVKIIFEDKSIPILEKTVQGKDADGKVSSVTYEIKQNNKGKWKLAMSSWKPIEEAQKEMAEREIIYIENQQNVEQPPASTTIVTTQTLTTETNYPNNASVNMNVNVNEGTESTNVNVNMGLPGVSATATQTHNTQTTIITTNTTTGTYSETYEEDPMPGYSGYTNCDYPMSELDFSDAKGSISSKDFEDSKLTVAKQVINSNCLFVSQVKEIMGFFDFEDTRLEFAKAAYSSTYDINNYYQLNDAFEYELTIDELNEFIQNQ